MKNEQQVWRETIVINVFVSYRHMNRSWNVYMYPFFLLQTLMEHATELFPWHACAHTHSLSLSNPFPAGMSEKAISGT